MSKDLNKMLIELDAGIYTKEAVLRTGSILSDQAIISYSQPDKSKINVQIEFIEQTDQTKFKQSFFNELANVILRDEIAKRNQKITEYIVGGAMFAALFRGTNNPNALDPNHALIDVEKEIENLRKELEAMNEETCPPDYEQDNLNIRKVADSQRN